MFFKKKQFLDLTVAALILLGCNSKIAKYPPGGPYYFQSYNGHYLPFRPAGEMTLEWVKAIEKEGGIYCKAYFDDRGRITILEKYEDGEFIFQDKYYYED